ncbi:MAG: PspC domain-containing protein [Tetrasphaera sp.]
MTSSPAPDAIVDQVLDAVADVGITRRADDRWVAGICSGIAARFDIDPVVVRVATITLSLLTGLGVVAYGAAYLLLPAPDQPSPIARARAQGTNSVILLVLLGALTVLGIGAAFGGIDSFGSWSPVPVIPVLIGVALLYYFKGGLLKRGCAHGAGRGHRFGRSFAGRRAPGHRGATAAPPPPPAGTSVPAPGTVPATGQSAPQDGPPVADPVGPPVLIPVPAPPAGPGPVPFAQQWAPAASPTGASWLSSQPATPPAAPSQPSPWAQPAGPARPVAVRPRHRRLGVVGTLAGLGAALAAYGIAVLVHRASGADGSATPVGLAAALAALALVLIVAGSRGRRGGLVALVAFPLAIACGANAASGSDVWRDGAGERTWAPTTNAPADYRLGAGDAVLDLARFPQHASGQPPRIGAHVAFGQLSILIPKDLTVQVDSTIRWGNVSENDTVGNRRADTGGNDVHLSRTYGSGEPDVVVTATVTGGEVAVTRK